MPETIVIGAGLSGLTAAYTLHQAGRNVLVLEAGSRPGGLIQTITEDVFQVEAGPNTFPSTAQELIALAHTLGLTPKPTSPHANKRYLYLKGQLTALPNKPWQALTTPTLSWQGKLRVLQEPFQPRTTTPDISVAGFVEKRLGAEVLNHLVDPFISGIYAGNVAELSLPAVFPKLWEWEQSGGSLFKGARLAQQKARQSSQPRKGPMSLLSFEGGLSKLPNALAMALPPEQILYGHRVTQLEKRLPTGYRVHTHTGDIFECQHLILATPAYTASQLLQDLCPQASHTLGQIPYNSLTVTHVGFPKAAIPHPLDGFGCLVPQREKLPLLGVIWASSLFPERAPDDQVLLSCFAGGAHHPELASWPPEAIQKMVLENLQTIFKTPEPMQPVFCQTLRYEKGIPQYTLGHQERIQTAKKALAAQHPNIHMCGNHLHGIALNECVKSGQTAATQVIKS